MTSEQIEISERELEILQLVATGATNQQIAQQLHISTNTVKVHLRNINAKIGATSRTEATLYALRRGWVKLDDAPLTEPQSDPSDDTSDEDTPERAFTDHADAPAAEHLPIADAPAADPTDSAQQSAAPHTPLHQHRRRWLLIGALGIVVTSVLLLILFIMQPGLFIQSDPAATNGPNTGSVQPPDATPPIIDTSNRWRELAPMPAPRAGFGMARYELNGQDFLYAIGGTDGETVHTSVFRFDINANRWTQRTDKPTAVSDVQAVVVGSNVYVPGGRLESGAITDAFDVYDPVRDSWSSAAPLPEPRSAYALAVVEGKIYLFGGWDGEQYRADVWQYNPDQNNWIEQTPLSQPRAYASAATINGRIHVIGGEDDTGPLALHERYNPATETQPGGPWDLRARLPEARSNIAASSISGIIFVTGDNADVPLLLYDDIVDEWQQQTIPLEAVQGLRTEAVGNQLYIFGGGKASQPGTHTYAYQTLYIVVVPLGS
jgi:DNA-binding CsgD family transcriptional regulator